MNDECDATDSVECVYSIENPAAFVSISFILRHMKYPNVPVREPRVRRAGSLPAFRLTAILAAVILAAPFATALTSEPARAATPGSNDSPEITAAKKKVADLQTRLHTLLDQMAKLKAQEPQDPGPNGTEDARKKYKTAHASWQQQVDKVQHQIDVVNQQLAVAQHELQGLQAKAGQGGH